MVGGVLRHVIADPLDFLNLRLSLENQSRKLRMVMEAKYYTFRFGDCDWTPQSFADNMTIDA